MTGTLASSATSPADGGRALKHGLVRLAVVYLVLASCVVAVCLTTGRASTVSVAVLAASVCFLAAAAANVCSIYPRGDVFIATRLYLSSAVRIAVPVALLLVVKFRFPELIAEGMVYLVFLFYLVGLVTDVASQFQRLKSLKSDA